MEHILLIIDEMRDEWYKPPTSYYHRKKISFECQSYARSVMKEIKMYLIEHQNEDPIYALEQFKYQIDCFASQAKNGSVNFMFSIYYDVVSDVIDVLLSMK